MQRREELTALWKRRVLLHSPTEFLKAVSKSGNKGSSVNAVPWYGLSCSPARSRLWKTRGQHAVPPRVISRTRERSRSAFTMELTYQDSPRSKLRCPNTHKDLDNERNGEVAKVCSNTQIFQLVNIQTGCKRIARY